MEVLLPAFKETCLRAEHKMYFFLNNYKSLTNVEVCIYVCMHLNTNIICQSIDNGRTLVKICTKTMVELVELRVFVCRIATTTLKI